MFLRLLTQLIRLFLAWAIISGGTVTNVKRPMTATITTISRRVSARWW